MKAALGLPVTLLITIVLAVIILLAALVMLNIIPGLEETEALKGYFSTCCTAYNIAGHCEEGAENPDFLCAVDEKFAPGGKMTISELASRIGVPVESCCK